MAANRILISSLILASLVCTAVHASDQNVPSRCATILRKFALLAVAPATDAEKYVYIIGSPVGLSYVFDYPDWMAYAYVGGYFLYKKFSAKTPSTSRGALNYLLNLLHDMIEALKGIPFEHLKTLGKTLDRWKVEIARMLRFSKSNGITEGFHNKMEMLSRRAFGFRNFQNYRLRVLAHCGWDGVFTRF